MGQSIFSFFSIFLKMDDKQQYTEKKQQKLQSLVVQSFHPGNDGNDPQFLPALRILLLHLGSSQRTWHKLVIMSDPVAKMIKNCRSIYI
jgi:hypothetical protein